MSFFLVRLPLDALVLLLLFLDDDEDDDDFAEFFVVVVVAGLAPGTPGGGCLFRKCGGTYAPPLSFFPRPPPETLSAKLLTLLPPALSMVPSRSWRAISSPCGSCGFCKT